MKSLTDLNCSPPLIAVPNTPHKNPQRMVAHDSGENVSDAFYWSNYYLFISFTLKLVYEKYRKPAPQAPDGK